MIGLDTLLFTKEGFKKLRDLNLYDEVLTPLGMFEPIMKMSEVDEIDNYVKLSTDEIIPCSYDLEFLVYNENHTEKFIFAEDIMRRRYYTSKILPYDCKNSSKEDYYELGTKIPNKITDKILTLSSFHRYELFCGLMDTPICSLKTEDGVYEFRPHSYEFEKGLVSLFRSFGFPVTCGVCDKRRYVKTGIQNLLMIYDINLRDKYKDVSETPPDIRYAFMPIKDGGKLDNSVKGRSISLKGNMVLVGYSLVPVKCQIL